MYSSSSSSSSSMLVIGRRLPTVSGSQAMLRRSRTAPYHVGCRVLSSSSGLQGVRRGALHGHANHGPCGRRGVRGARGARPQRWQQATRPRGECRVRRLQRLRSPSLCGTWLRWSSSPRARGPGVHAHLLDLCLCGLRLHVEDIPRLRLHHTAPYHRLLRRSTHLATVCTQQEHRA